MKILRLLVVRIRKFRISKKNKNIKILNIETLNGLAAVFLYCLNSDYAVIWSQVSLVIQSASLSAAFYLLFLS